MMYMQFPFSLRNVEDLPFDRGIEICFETVRIWWTRFGPEEFCAAPFPLAGDKYRFDCPHRHTVQRTGLHTTLPTKEPRFSRHSPDHIRSILVLTEGDPDQNQPLLLTATLKRTGNFSGFHINGE